MLCEKCKKNEASYYYSETVNGKKRSIALCSECAPKDISFGSSFLSGLFSENPFQHQVSAHDYAKKCDTCGCTFYDIKKTGKAGCSECYKVFRDEFAPIIRRIHGNAVYKGRPQAAKVESADNADNKPQNEEELDELSLLREQLKNAVESENYELAAKIRDDIRSFSENGKKKEEN